MNNMVGWCRVKQAAKYAGVSERTFRDWLRRGLKHARLPSDHILVSYAAVDAWLNEFVETETQAGRIVGETMQNHAKKCGGR
jgi:excisionase family DNA binding protein